MKRYETLMPDDVIRICKEWNTEDPPWCKGMRYDPEDVEFYCTAEEEDLRCEDCLRRWLEEEISPDPVWYSKQFVMEQVAALIEHDESGLSLFHILDEVLADTPEQIRYSTVEKYFKAMEEADSTPVTWTGLDGSERTVEGVSKGEKTVTTVTWTGLDGSERTVERVSEATIKDMKEAGDV